MPHRETALRKYHEGSARSSYDTGSDRIETFRRQYVGRLGLKPGETVLDVGCGTGFSFPMLEEAVGPQGRVIGIEQSPDQLALARALVERSGWHNVTLLNSPVEDANIPAGADAALISFSHDIMRTPKGLENVIRSLKPGARIVAVGMKWAPWWALGVNLRTWRIARTFITTFEGFSRPWSHLANLVSSLEVEPLVLSQSNRGSVGIYIAVGQK
jgi:ubiquinone/menaquinone biosynthesis C-methylase UbiE